MGSPRVAGQSCSSGLRGCLRCRCSCWRGRLRFARAWSDDRLFPDHYVVGFFAAFSMAPMLVVVIAFARLLSSVPTRCRGGCLRRLRA